MAAIESVADGLAALTKVVSGRLADRWRRRPLVGTGYGLAAVGKLLIALATVWPAVLLARVIDRAHVARHGRVPLLVAGTIATVLGLAVVSTRSWRRLDSQPVPVVRIGDQWP